MKILVEYLLLFIYFLFPVSGCLYGQYTDEELNEKFKGRLLDAAEKQAEKLFSEGWDVYNDKLTLAERIQTTWVVEKQINSEAELRYISEKGHVLSSSLEKAEEEAIKWTSLRFAEQVMKQDNGYIDVIGKNAEEKFSFEEALDKVPEKVRIAFNVLENIDFDYIFKVYRQNNNGIEVQVEVFYKQEDIETVLHFAKQMNKEMKNSGLFKPRDEFESTRKYYERVKRGKKFSARLLKEYKSKYADISNRQTEEQPSLKREKIKESFEKITLPVESVGEYDPDNQKLPVTINKKTVSLNMNPEEAKIFKQNKRQLAVTADKQLMLDGITWDVFNIVIENPVTGKTYTFGKQKKPLFLDITTEKDETVQDSDKETSPGVSSSNPSKFLPPMLKIEELKFIDQNQDNRINANEDVSIDFTLKNTGPGQAFDLELDVELRGDTAGIRVQPVNDGIKLYPDGIHSFSIPIHATMKVKRGTVVFRIKFKEKNGFDSDPVEVSVKTLEFQEPLVEVVDHEFTSAYTDQLELGSPINLKLFVQNTGQGKAEDVNAYFKVPKINVFAVSNHSYSLGTLKSGESRELNFQFVGNKKYTYQNIPVQITLNEKYRQYARSTTISAPLSPRGNEIQRIDIASEKFQEKDIEKASLTPDVDKNIPVAPVSKPNLYALIIGNESYLDATGEVNEELNYDFAKNDARVFREYVVKTLGAPVENVMFFHNATIADMNRGIAYLSTISKLRNEEAELMIYYAGHGISDMKTKEAYLLPVDFKGDLSYAMKVNDMYKQLTRYPSKKITVFIDASFSGGTRSGSHPVPIPGQRIVFGANQVSGNIIEFLACSGDQTAQAYREKQHGLFTYFVLKKLQLSGGNISFKELGEYVQKEVGRESEEISGIQQTPTINFGNQSETDWQSWSFGTEKK